ncbi:MAG: TonB-dependent receptor [Methylococcaceae bacterium]|nr:TonB-dependent receptor [Methylococcaceae bacterium]
MQIRQSIGQLCLIAIIHTIFTGTRTAYAIETLPDITVTAPQKSLADRVNNLQLLDNDDITIAHERSISDVLTGLPGITLSRSGGFGQAGPIFVRGAGGQGVMTLDDIPLLLSLPGFLNLDTMPTEAIEKAEIDRGPGAAYYPFQSLGGTIRLYTHDRQDTGGRLSVEGGSFGILRETLQGGLAGDLGRMTVTLNRADAFNGGHLADPEDNPEREPSHFSQGIMRFTSFLTSRLKWQGSMLYRNSATGIDQFGIDKHSVVALTDDANSIAREETWLAQSSLNLKATSNWDSNLQLGYTQLATHLNAGPLQNGVFTRLFLVNWRNQYKIIDDLQKKTQWHITWGGQGRHEQGAAPVIGFSQARTMTAGFIDMQAQYGEVSAETGVRLESFDQLGQHALFKAAAAWDITAGLTLRATGGTGYRIPSYTELLFLFFGNPALKPERSTSGSLGIEWFPVASLNISLNGYYQQFHELITPAYERFRGPITVNVADAGIAGMEADAKYGWTDALETGISYSYSDSRNLQNNKNLTYRPQHTARLWGQQKMTPLPLTLWAEAVVRSASWNDLENTLPIADSVQVNAAIRYAIFNKAEIYLRGENLTNNRSSQLYSAAMPGIAVYGGFKLDF